MREKRFLAFRKKDWIQVGFTVMSCLLVSFILGLLGENITKYFHASSNGYLIYFFDKNNRDGEKRFQSNPYITLFFPEDSSMLSADSIVKTLGVIASYDPKVIAVDILYDISDTITNTRIAQGLDSIKSKHKRTSILFPSTINKNKPDSIEYHCSSFEKEALYSAALPDFWHFSRNDDNDTSKVRFSFAIAEKSGYLRNEIKNCKDYSSFIPNYTSKRFITCMDFKGADTITFQDKIVIVGDIKDIKDSKRIPFYIEGTRDIPGVMLHAYIVNSLIKNPEDKYLRKIPITDYKKKNNDIYTQSPFGWNLLYCFILLLFPTIFVHFFNNSLNKRKTIKFILLKLVVILVWELAAYVCSYHLTKQLLVVFNLVMLLLSILFIEAFDEISRIIYLRLFEKIEKKKNHL